MAIPQHTIDQILDRTDLVDLVGKYVKLKKSGRSYSGCCPFHQEKTPSFHVYRDKQYYHCFGCQSHGNAIRFLMDIEGRNFLDVMQQLSQQTGIELPKNNFEQKKLTYQKKPQLTAPVQAKTPNEPAPSLSVDDLSAPPAWTEFDDFHFTPDQTFVDHEPSNEGNLYDLLEMVTQFYQQQLQNSPKAQHYFKQRGLSQTTINNWRLGYAPESWQHLEQVFPQDIEGLKLLGLIRTSDNGRDFDLLRERVIFPIRDHKGRIVGFGGRALNDEVKPKYINSPESEIFRKNQLLYGLYEGSKQKAQDWLMVEGYMDVIALHQNGVYGAVATLGTASNSEHLQQLFKRNRRVTLAFDGDTAGQKAARRTLEIALPLLNDGRELQFFVLPNEHDPDSLIRQEGVEHFLQLWQQSPLLSDFLYSLISKNYNSDSPEGKGLIMAELKTFTDLLPQGSFKYILNQFFREKLGLAWKRFSTPEKDANLSFQIQNRTEDMVIALLIEYPSLYLHFEILRAYMPQNELLTVILNIFDQIYDKLPNELQAQHYYILGACGAYQNDIKRIMQHIPNELLQGSAEKIDRLAQDFALHLHSKYLKEKIKQTKSLQESKHLRLQLNEISQKIAFSNHS